MQKPTPDMGLASAESVDSFDEQTTVSNISQSDDKNNVEIAPGTDFNDDPAPKIDPPEPYNSGSAYKINELVALTPEDKFIYLRTGKLWSRATVDERFKKVETGGKYDNGKPIKIRASQWLAQYRNVEGQYWMPGEPQIIKDTTVNEGGMNYNKGLDTYNGYLPPFPPTGDPKKAKRWIELVQKVFPSEADYLIKWFAYKVQNPGVKINHALVLGGKQGVGKDTIIEAPIQAVGEHNAKDVSPQQLLGNFSGYVRSVILRVSEASDMGKRARKQLYEETKTLISSPPNQLPCNIKHVKVYPVANVCGVVITTNHKTGGIYIPDDDRRHHISWSPLDKADFEPSYFRNLWEWYNNGGFAHVAAYLNELDVSKFDPKATPPKTNAFFEFVEAGKSPLSIKFGTALEEAGNPDAISMDGLKQYAEQDVLDYINDPKNHRNIPQRMDDNDYTKAFNPNRKDNRWKINGKIQTVYAKTELSKQQKIEAANQL